MADKKVKVKVDVETNAEGSIAQLKELTVEQTVYKTVLNIQRSSERY